MPISRLSQWGDVVSFSGLSGLPNCRDPYSIATRAPFLCGINRRPTKRAVSKKQSLATLVDKYAAFIHATADDVVNKALHYVFSKDRDFQNYLKSSDARRTTPTLRVRRSAVLADTKPKPTPRAVAGVESIESARVEKP